MKRGALAVLVILVTLLSMSATVLADRGIRIPDPGDTMMSMGRQSL